MVWCDAGLKSRAGGFLDHIDPGYLLLSLPGSLAWVATSQSFDPGGSGEAKRNVGAKVASRRI